ncbi:MAG TPA: histidine kinase [Ignavibacteriaceae bacterium]|nr:MAG: Sensor histidine kinase YehU [Ignavibacteria bacterium ADurb.Bin266]OQY75977.1 MAG: hypothetical protein B6D44_00515 [Ignavibacteriales bacterium UTCHB2]HQF41390.1 histidine kinase [Ignavibacteriaceae bacterium]HQI41077.1 histidine kinase [Ignavibacteriaceae bacterium]
MKKPDFRSIYRFILTVFLIVNVRIEASELPANNLTSSSTMINLKHWQIIKDAEPNKPLTSLPDSLWQILDSDVDEDLYSVGNWLLKTDILITDSLDDKRLIGLFPLNFITAYEIYWDGIKIGQNGKIGINENDEVAGNYNFNLTLPLNLLKNGKHTIVFRISNHNNYSSWKWFYGDIVIGKYDFLLEKIYQLYYRAFFITGILFIPFLFNLFLYLARKRKIEHLIFSLICLIVIIDSTTMLTPVLTDTRTTFINWQYFAYNLITLLFTILFPIFFIYLFSFPKKIIGLIIVITLIIFFFFTNFLNVFEVMTLTVLILSTLITLWALFKRKEESIVIILGIIAAWAAYYFNFAFAGFATTMVVCTSFSVARQFARKEKTEREAQLRSAQLETELLKKNINPHFVLNTLTSVIVWLRKDSAAAIKLIVSLAEEFRMINQISALKQIPINQEIDLCKSHLKIMSYRKGANYKFETFDIDEKETVPPMIFHTLVENGITHGYEKKIEGTFKLQSIKNAQSKKYILSNDGDFNQEDTKRSTGFGVKYIKSRLEESYPGKWNFTSNKCATGWESIIEVRN